MKRYFYTDPLAAAWMAKHHGMRFDLPRQSGGSPWDLLIEVCVHRETGAIDGGSALPPIYIHPDSLRLLEPIDGDVIDCRDCANNVGCGFQDYISKVNEPLGQMILRDGKPFFWPESEES